MNAHILEKANKLLWSNVQLSQLHWCVCAGGEVSWCKERLLSPVVKMRLSVNRAKWFGFCLPPQAGVRWSTTPRSTLFLLPGSWNIIRSNQKIFTKENVKDFWTKNTKTFSETVIFSPHWLITAYQLFMELLSVNRMLTGNSIMHNQWSSTANNQTPRKSPVANLTVASVSCNRSGRNPPITRQPPPAARFPGCSL